MQETNQVTVADMSAAREARAMAQMELLSRYPGAAVVCLTMNIAGPVKLDDQIEQAFVWGLREVRAVLAHEKLLFSRIIREKTGPEAVFCVEGDATGIKRRLCVLEEGPSIGRLLDIDVLHGQGKKVSRTELGLPVRRCLLCGQPAPVCARSRAHSVQELRNRTSQIIEKHFEEEFARLTGEMAQRALLFEAAVSPKPGLVDRMNAGAHDDMDFFTFVSSACALREYFEACARTGLAFRGRTPEACFDALRVPGLLAEADMLRATRGVNTHKGAIFSLGIFCAALGMGFDGMRSEPEAALERCGQMTKSRMEAELGAIAAREAATFGEKHYQLTGAGGVRAEAASGFSGVQKAGLPRLKKALERGLSLNDAGLCALVALMACTQDTNAVRRGGEAGAEWLMKRASELDAQIAQALKDGTINAQNLRGELARWDEEVTEQGISPGGSADMLALTLLAHFMTQPEALSQQE